MPQITIPLAGSYNTRPGITFVSNPKDERMIGAYIDSVKNTSLNSSSPYVVKRGGIQQLSTIVASKSARALCVSSTNRFCVIFSDGTVYFKNTEPSTAVAVGAGVTGTTVFITSVSAADEEFFMISSNTQGGFFLPLSAALASPYTFTADTNGTTTLSNVSSFTGLFVGQALSGTDIDTGARIASLNPSGSSLEMTLAATGTTATVTVTFTATAKIIDADFPSSIRGPFQSLDGYYFIMTQDGKIYNSESNEPWTWDANDYIAGSQSGITASSGYGLGRIKNRIIGFYSGNHEYYFNNGNPSGSVLSLIKETSSNIGIIIAATCGDYIVALGKPGGEQSNNLYLFAPDGVREITTPQIARILSQSTHTALTISGGRLGGYDAFFIQIVNTSISFVYFVGTDSWCETGFSSDYIFFGGYFEGGLYAVNRSDSDLYKISSTIFQDDGAAFTMTIQTQPYSLNNGEGFTINRISLLADNQASGTTAIYTSKDDYGTWVSKGSFDMTSTKKEIHRGGFYRSSCAFKLEHSANTAWRGQAIVVDWEPAVT